MPELSCGDPGTGNLIVQGDNLIALKALLPYYAGQVKCIYIDPPYNTGNEKWAYNDNVNSPVIRDWLGKVVGGEGEIVICYEYSDRFLVCSLLAPEEPSAYLADHWSKHEVARPVRALPLVRETKRTMSEEEANVVRLGISLDSSSGWPAYPLQNAPPASWGPLTQKKFPNM